MSEPLRLDRVTVHARISAEPTSRGDYCLSRGWDMPADENPLDEGYKVSYHDADGYTTWLPAHVAERAFRIGGSFQDRVKQEYADLRAKHQALLNFTHESLVYAALPTAEKDRLTRQADAMSLYAGILEQRIKAFGSLEAA